MTYLNDPGVGQPFGKFLYPLTDDESLTWTGYIRTGQSADAGGEDLQTVLDGKLDMEALVDVRSDTPVASASTKWFVYRSDEKRLYVKTRTGTAPNYTYGYTDAFSANDYQLRLIYHTAEAPSPPGISWNAANQTFNITSGGWAITDANATWMRIVVLPALTNAPAVSPPLRLGTPGAGDIAYTPPTRDGFFPSPVSTEKEALDYVHEHAANKSALTPSPSSTTGLIQTIEVNRPSGQLLGVGSVVQGQWTVNSALREFQSDFNGTVFLEANVRVLVQRTVADLATIGLRFEIVDATGAVLASPIAGTGSLMDSISEIAHTTLRIAGNLPANFPGGRWRLTTISNTGTALAYIDKLRIALRSDLKTDEVIPLQAELGNNFPGGEAQTLSNLLQDANAWPLQLADTYDVLWPPAPNGIDDNGEWVLRSLPIARLLRSRNARSQQTFIAKVRYQGAYVTGSRTDRGVDAVNFSHRVWANLPDGLSHAQLDARASLTTADIPSQSATATTQTLEFRIPTDADSITVGVKSDTAQADARLAITEYTVEIERGIDSSGYTASGRLLDTRVHSFQSVADRLQAYVPHDNHTAAGVSVDATQFSDAGRFPGGLLEVLPAGFNVANAPDDVQATLDKIDVLLQLLDNPFVANQALDFGVSATEALSVSDSNVHRSNPINVPQELRELGVNIAIRVRVRLNAIQSSVRGRLALVRGDSPFTRVGDNQIVNGSLQGANTYVTFQRVIPAADIQTTYRLQFQRTSSTGNVTFDRGVGYMVDSEVTPTQGQGQAASYSARNIWVAGGSVLDRLTASSTQTLLAGNHWGQFHLLQFEFDNGPQAGNLLPLMVTADAFRASSSHGTQTYTDLLGYLVQPISGTTNQFSFVWGNQGLRRIVGINTI